MPKQSGFLFWKPYISGKPLCGSNARELCKRKPQLPVHTHTHTQEREHVIVTSAHCTNIMASPVYSIKMLIYCIVTVEGLVTDDEKCFRLEIFLFTKMYTPFKSMASETHTFRNSTHGV